MGDTPIYGKLNGTNVILKCYSQMLFSTIPIIFPSVSTLQAPGSTWITSGRSCEAMASMDQPMGSPKTDALTVSKPPISKLPIGACTEQGHNWEGYKMLQVTPQE